MNPTSAPLLALHEISLYNTGRISPEKIIAAFAARVTQFERIVADLAAEKPRSRAQHHLIVGQRGMGKTMLLARIAAELRTKDELSARFIPLVFAEEQYAVDRLSKFWLNCLDSLADAREIAKDTAAVEEIDANVKRLQSTGVRPPKEDQPFADEVYAAFAKAAQATGQRPVLLVDNLQLVFERLDPGQQHSLRELLMRPGSPILIGASPSPPPQSQDYGAAFYDQFKIHYLRPLEEAEMRTLLLHLADAAQRDDVRQRVLQHPARLKVLRQLTGGNPRTTLTLFFLYAEDFAPSVFGDLEGLLDRVTPLYKARFEELTAQQQVITSAIANHWDPVTSAKLVAATGLPAGTISAQLDRLEKTGVIERTELFGDTRTGYLLAERFFNIWFLMRSASRRQRREVEFLTRFLESFYEPTERSRIAKLIMNEEHFSPDRYIWSQAVAASLAEAGMAEDLKRHLELAALREEAREARNQLHDLIDFDSLPPSTIAFEDLRKKIASLISIDSGLINDNFAKLVLGDRAMFMNDERSRLGSRSGALSKTEVDGILKMISKSKASDVLSYGNEAVSWFSDRIASGQLRHKEDAEDWNRAFQQAEDASLMLLLADSVPPGVAKNIERSNIQRVTKLLKKESPVSPEDCLTWSTFLHEKFALYPEADYSYKIAISSLLDELRRIDGEIKKYEVLSVNLKENSPQTAKSLDLYSEIISIYKKLSRPNLILLSLAYYSRGMLLQYGLMDYSEAEKSFTSILSLEGGMEVLLRLFNELASEETENDGTIKSRQETQSSLLLGYWNNLGILYMDFLGRPTDAVRAYEHALSFDSTAERILQNRLFLQRDFMGGGVTSIPFMHDLKALSHHEFLDTTLLHEALFAAYDLNWALACEAMAKAIAIRTDGFSPLTTDDWLRSSAVLIHLNYGSELLAFLNQLGETTARLRPWVESLRALHIGDRKALQNIAPEIRSTAEEFYDGIERRLLILPEKTRRRPLPKPKKSRK